MMREGGCLNTARVLPCFLGVDCCKNSGLELQGVKNSKSESAPLGRSEGIFLKAGDITNFI